VPIFWNKKVAEKTAVLEAAERVQALLRGAGVKCDTDTTTELTPGQKMRSWCGGGEQRTVPDACRLASERRTGGCCAGQSGVGWQGSRPPKAAQLAPSPVLSPSCRCRWRCCREEKGVMLRVELGGKEAEAGTAVVARCTTPGEARQPALPRCRCARF
jgi:hypothetical protein